MAEKRCFVIAPIGLPGSIIRRRSNKILRKIIRPAVEECGYAAVRADEIDHPGLITRQVVRRIRDDQLVVADLTGQNPNVFYELAIRHLLRKPLIQLIDSGEEIPFDVRDMRTIEINHRNSKGVEEAKQAIVNQIRKFNKGLTRLETPISEAMIPKQRPAGDARALPGPGRTYRARHEEGRVEGKRLFQHSGFYPIVLSEENIPSLSQSIFEKAIKRFLKDKHYDRLAAMDLVYLREDNFPDKKDILSDEGLRQYNKLVKKYDLHKYIESFREENERIFSNFKRLVNNIGDTLSNVHMELVLHNARNPIRSVVALRNTRGISNRKMFDPSTRFVVQYVENQGRQLIKAMEGGSKVGYLKHLGPGRQVKATTIPLYDERYGLVGILCLNIDIESVNSLDAKGRDEFFKNYLKITGPPPEFEI